MTLKLVAVAVVFLLSAPVWAQDAPDASQDQSGGDAAQQPESQYGGPSILSRGGVPSVLRGGDLARIVPFVSATADYNSDLGPYTLGPGGRPIYDAGFGVIGTVGVTGSHSWEHSVLDLDYRGTYRDYADFPEERGLDNSLDLAFSHQLSSRLSITLSEEFARTHSIESLPLGGLYSGGMPGYNSLYNALTANSLLTTPALASVSAARLVYQRTARLSFSVGASAIVAREQAQQTIGANGYIGSADLAYRVSRYQTLSVAYNFTHFTYLGQLGTTNMHGVVLGYSARLGRYWELQAAGGATRVASLRNVTVDLDPALAQLLGESVLFQKTNSVFYMPNGSLHLTRSFRHSSWMAGYDRSVVAGNGLYTTSGYETVASTYTYSGLRRLSLQAGAGYYRLSAMTQGLGNYRSFGASGGFGYRLAKGFSTVGRIDGRRYYVLNSLFDRNGYIATFGFSWNPGEYPLAIW
jgi:hypothetical protein